MVEFFFQETVKRFPPFLSFLGQSCQWTRHQTGKDMGYGPIFGWSCQIIEKNSKNKDLTIRRKTIGREEKCPIRCHLLKNCADCLESNGSEGEMIQILFFLQCRISLSINRVFEH